MNYLRSRIFLLIVVMSTFFSSVFPQEARVDQKKTTKEQSRKKKEADKKYRLDLKRHYKMQSKETRSMMKQSKKRAKRITPLK